MSALLHLLPALLLLVVLLLRRYPGERRLVAAVAARRSRRSSRDAIRSPRPRVLVPRGGRLIASALAVRPPPHLHTPA